MKHEDRRKELGKMLMDVAKYLATVGLIGSFLTRTLTFEVGLVITIVVLGLTIIAFYTIPPKKGGIS
ncbi:MAG: hypothetical protein HY805_11035 [Nitrospirae bacterium]|nr:hypothetical protein [Nitrospirota bacterium]